ncbi:putative nucleic acid-binding Zn-ribbon protein [Inquilinus ginsengisoli]|uniref:hypothetical protein n=1 Tax=Inquilinus ginsengisoli TaxID=363840 RepID=UPI003D23FA18
MNQNVESVILEHLRHIRAQVDSLREVQSEHGRRLLTIESGIASLRREQAGDAETVVNVQAQIDRLREEVQRIKRRLELAP